MFLNGGESRELPSLFLVRQPCGGLSLELVQYALHLSSTACPGVATIQHRRSWSSSVASQGMETDPAFVLDGYASAYDVPYPRKPRREHVLYRMSV